MTEHWVFAYGSLMWRPGFDFQDSVEGILEGAHRSLCVYSVVHRGTRQRPGLVLGLDVGGRCRGRAFRVSAEDYPHIRNYLRAREQVTRVYREVVRPISLVGEETRRVRALCYLADRLHPQYAGLLPLGAQVRHVRDGHGKSGNNVAYVVNTVRCLEDMQIHEPTLHRVMAELGYGPGRAR